MKKPPIETWKPEERQAYLRVAELIISLKAKLKGGQHA